MAAQVAAEAAEEEEHKGSNISSQKANMYNPRPKRDRQEAVSAARGTTTSTSALNSPQTKRHSCLSKTRRGRKMTMMVITRIMTQMEITMMVFVGSTWTNHHAMWKELDAW